MKTEQLLEFQPVPACPVGVDGKLLCNKPAVKLMAQALLCAADLPEHHSLQQEQLLCQQHFLLG